jgi:hypothetical protein
MHLGSEKIFLLLVVFFIELIFYGVNDYNLPLHITLRLKLARIPKGALTIL